MMKNSVGMRKWISSFVLCVSGLLASIPVTAAEVAVTGYGVTPRLAVTDALIEAVRQVNGVAVESQQVLDSVAEELLITDDEGDSIRYEYNGNLTQGIATATNGLIAGYRVVSISRGENEYIAEVTADVPKYETPGIKHNRRRLAVLDVLYGDHSYDLFGEVDAPSFANELTSALVEQFVHSRKFTVLDRQNLDLVAQERRLLESAAVPVAEKAKLLATKGADYLVVTRIISAYSGLEERHRQVTGERWFEPEGRVALELRVIVPATTEIRYSDRVEVDLNSGTQVAASRSQVLNRVSNAVVGQAVDAIYPIRVIKITGDGQLVLNQGGDTLARGEVLDLYSEGEMLYDPYTEEPLGREQAYFGGARVIRVDQKVSYASLTGSASGQLKAGMVARRQVDGGTTGAGTDAVDQAQWGTRERVVLPQDRRRR